MLYSGFIHSYSFIQISFNRYLLNAYSSPGIIENAVIIFLKETYLRSMRPKENKGTIIRGKPDSSMSSLLSRVPVSLILMMATMRMKKENYFESKIANRCKSI